MPRSKSPCIIARAARSVATRTWSLGTITTVARCSSSSSSMSRSSMSPTSRSAAARQMRPAISHSALRAAIARSIISSDEGGALLQPVGMVERPDAAVERGREDLVVAERPSERHALSAELASRLVVPAVVELLCEPGTNAHPQGVVALGHGVVRRRKECGRAGVGDRRTSTASPRAREPRQHSVSVSPTMPQRPQPPPRHRAPDPSGRRASGSPRPASPTPEPPRRSSPPTHPMAS